MRSSTLGGTLLVAVLAACTNAKQAPKPVAAGGVDPRAAIFVEKGCHSCHAIPLLGIAAVSDLGPNLDDAYQHVPDRVGLTLDEFFRAPTGTMQAVLRSQVRLSAVERDSIVTILKQLHKEHEAAEAASPR